MKSGIQLFVALALAGGGALSHADSVEHGYSFAYTTPKGAHGALQNYADSDEGVVNFDSVLEDYVPFAGQLFGVSGSQSTSVNSEGNLALHGELHAAPAPYAVNAPSLSHWLEAALPIVNAWNPAWESGELVVHVDGLSASVNGALPDAFYGVLNVSALNADGSEYVDPVVSLDLGSGVQNTSAVVMQMWTPGSDSAQQLWTQATGSLSLYFWAEMAQGGSDLNVDVSGRVWGEYRQLSASEVPVPAAGWLMLSALGGLAATRRRAA